MSQARLVYSWESLGGRKSECHLTGMLLVCCHFVTTYLIRGGGITALAEGLQSLVKVFSSILGL